MLKWFALAGFFGTSAPLLVRRASASPADPWTPAVLSAQQNATITALCESIIPETETPGAANARVNRYVDAVLADAEPSVRARFLERVDRFTRDWSNAVADPAALLEKADADLFHEIKTLTIRGYYTSEVVMRTELGEM